MADTDIERSQGQVQAPDTTTGGPAHETPSPMPMLQAASTSLGNAAVRQKVARRLARRAVNLSSVADSLALSSAGEGVAAAAGGGGSPPAVDVAEKGFSGAAQEIPHRKEMEQSFGMDFSGVRAYTDGNAGAANQALNSHAYAMGDQIAFKTASPDKATVAHELTHVVQQAGAGPSMKSDSDDGIDVSGEGQAEAVEAAVAAGKPASSVLGAVQGGGGVARKLARKEEGGKFGMGMSFSREGFEKSYQWELWKGHIPDIPTPIPGVAVMIEPAVVVKGKLGAAYGGENAGNLSLSLGVEGGVLVALAGGVPNLATVYGGIEATVAGEAVFNSQTAPEEHHGAGGGGGGGGHQVHKKEESGGGGAGHGHAPAQTHAKPGGWNLSAGITASAAVKVGIKLGPGGMIDNSIELAKGEIFKITGIYFDQGGFHKEKLGFEWGKDMKELFEAIKHAWEKAKELAAAGWDMAKKAGRAVYNGAKDFVHFVTSW